MTRPPFQSEFQYKISKMCVSSSENSTSIEDKIRTEIPGIIGSYNDEVRAEILGIIGRISHDLAPLSELSNLNFAILGLGSLARGEMVPGSDFEYAILLDKDFKEKSKEDEYFTSFHKLLKTELEAIGIKMDGAGTHPLGDNGKNRLIGSVDQLLIFQVPHFEKNSDLVSAQEKSYKDNPYLFTILGSPILLYEFGNVGIVRNKYSEYNANIRGRLSSRERLQQIANSLGDSLQKHKPLDSRFGHENESKFNPKYDFYRISNLNLDHLDLYYGLEYKENEFRTTQSRIEKLSNSQVINSPKSSLITHQKENISSSYSKAMYLRAILPEIYDRDQAKEIDLNDPILEDVKKTYGVGYEELSGIISTIYSEIREIYIDANAFVQAHELDKKTSPYRAGYILKKQNKKETAEEIKLRKEKALEEFTHSAVSDPKHYNSHHKKSQIERSLNLNDEALKTLKDSFNKAEDEIHKVKNLRKQALIYQEQNDKATAKEKYFETLIILLGKQRDYRASSDTPKEFLVKTLIGLSKLDLEDEADQNKLKEYLANIKEISHFDKLKDSIKVVLGNKITKKELTELAKGVHSLIYSSEIKERLTERYLNPNTQNQTKKASPTILHITQQNINFTGRKEILQQLKESLNHNSSFAIVQKQAISGFGGIGKTQLAKKYALDNQDDYAIIWSFDAGEGMYLDQQFESLARSINTYHESLGIKKIESVHIEGREFRKTEILKDVKDRLGKIEKNYLLIFDNVKDASIREFFPQRDTQTGHEIKKHILITSRNSRCWEDKQINLSVFTRAEATFFLLKSIGAIDQNEELIEDFKARINEFQTKYEEAQRAASSNNDYEKSLSKEDGQTFQAFNLAKTLHDYPLALAQAAAYIKYHKTTGMNFVKYIELFEEQKSEIRGKEANIIQGKKEPAIIDDYARTISATFEVSLTAIKREERGLLANNVLMMCGFLDNKGITDQLIKAAIEKLGGNVDLDFGDVINILLEHSLIEKNQNSQKITEGYSMHDTVQEVIVDQLKKDQENYKDLWIKTLSVLNQQCHKYRVHEEERHALNPHLLKATADHKYNEEKLDLQNDGWCVVAKSYSNIGVVYFSQGKLEESLKQSKKAAAIQEIRAPDSPDLAESYNNIGAVYYTQGIFKEALEQHKKSLEMKKPDSLEAATSYNNIGLVHYSLGDLKEALKQYNKALEIRVVDNPNSLDSAISYNNIGLVHHERFDFDAALIQYQKALAILEKDERGSPDLATCYSNIGGVYKSKGDLTAALEKYEKAVAVMQKINAPDSLTAANFHNNIGFVYRSQGRLEEALEQHQKAFEIRIRNAPGSPVLAASYNNIGVVYRSQGRLEEALEQLQEAKKIQEIKEPNTLALANTYKNIGLTLRSQDRLKEALEQFQEAIKIQEIKGPNSPPLADFHKNIEEIYRSLGKSEEALIHLEKAERINKINADRSKASSFQQNSSENSDESIEPNTSTASSSASPIAESNQRNGP